MKKTQKRNTIQKIYTGIRAKNLIFIIVNVKRFSTSNYKLTPNSDNNSSPLSSEFSYDSDIQDPSKMTDEEIKEEIKNAGKGRSKFEELNSLTEASETYKLIDKFFERRKEELQAECERRGLYKSDTESISDSASDSASDTHNSQDNSHKDISNNSEGSSTNKRKFEGDENSSTQPNAPKRFKQDSSDVSGDTELYDFSGEDS